MPREHWVYVVQLDEDTPCHGQRHRGAVYVGETGKTPEERFSTHKAGGRTAAPIVRDHGIRLMPELGKGPFETREEAESEERRLRQELLEVGWCVKGGKSPMSTAFHHQ